MEELFIPLAFFATVVIILWKYWDGKQKVRLAAMDRGLVDEKLKYLFGSYSARPNRYGALKWGLAAFLIGVGLLITIPLQQFEWARYNEGELITGMIFLAGGLAFIIYYVIVSKKEQQEPG